MDGASLYGYVGSGPAYWIDPQGLYRLRPPARRVLPVRTTPQPRVPSYWPEHLPYRPSKPPGPWKPPVLSDPTNGPGIQRERRPDSWDSNSPLPRFYLPQPVPQPTNDPHKPRDRGKRNKGQTCENWYLDILETAKDSVCENNAGGCAGSPAMGCAELEERMANSNRCMWWRMQICDECYGGVSSCNKVHQDEIRKAEHAGKLCGYYWRLLECDKKKSPAVLLLPPSPYEMESPPIRVCK